LRCSTSKVAFKGLKSRNLNLVPSFLDLQLYWLYPVTTRFVALILALLSKLGLFDSNLVFIDCL